MGIENKVLRVFFFSGHLFVSFSSLFTFVAAKLWNEQLSGGKNPWIERPDFPPIL